MGQFRGTASMSSFSSMSWSRSRGSRPTRSSLLMNVRMGVARMRQTSISFSVCISTPFTLSMTINALSTAVSTR